MNNQPIKFRRNIILILVLGLVLIVGIIARNLILNGQVIRLQSAQPLYGQISQTLLNGTGANKVLSANNYTLSSPIYLDNNSWAVAQFTPQNGQGDKGYVLMNKVDGFYQVVLGPGTIFPGNISGVPLVVQQYLNAHGLLESDGN